MPMSWNYVCLIMTYLIIGCHEMGGAAVPLNSPLFFWPFCSKTNAIELVHEKDAVHPDKNTCPILETGPPELNLNVYLFNQSLGNWAEMKISGSVINDVGFLFMIYPDNCNGEIFKYKTKNDNEGTVNSMEVKLFSCKVYVMMYDDEGDRIVKAASDTAVPLATWSVVGISRERPTSNVNVRVNDVLGSGGSTNDVRARQFDLRGTVFVGSENDVPVKYQGRFCCLAIYDMLIPTSLNRGQLIANFQESNWPNPAQDVREPCPLASAYSGLTIFHLWPLSNGSLGYDVINDLSPLAPSDFQCMRYKELNDQIRQSIVYFDGSEFSYLQAQMRADALSEDFSIGIMLRADKPVEGNVWDFQASPANVDGICRMTLSLNVGYATLALSDCHGQPCGTVISTHQIPPNIWTFTYAIVSFSNHRAHIMIDLKHDTIMMTCMNNTVTQPTGTITMGNEQNSASPSTSNHGYHGSAACLTVIKGLVGRPQEPVVAERCVSLDTLQVNESQDECNVTPSIRTRHFQIEGTDSRPDVEINPIVNLTSRSLVECSKFCTGSAACRAFTYSKTFASHNCMAYDFVTRSGLVVDPGNNYYVIHRH